ncbi:MAG: YciI family protein [Alphaproteobacteria bacterium]|nr:YciI family protein [Alphaproteobacteria bacterium]
MLFAISCIDKPDSGHIRAQNRDAHLAYLRDHGDQLMAAGPYISESGDGMTGSLLILQFPDRSSAEAFAANDPYALAGLFERVSIRHWKKVLPVE